MDFPGVAQEHHQGVGAGLGRGHVPDGQDDVKDGGQAGTHEDALPVPDDAFGGDRSRSAGIGDVGDGGDDLAVLGQGDPGFEEGRQFHASRQVVKKDGRIAFQPIGEIGQEGGRTLTEPFCHLIIEGLPPGEGDTQGADRGPPLFNHMEFHRALTSCPCSFLFRLSSATLAPAYPEAPMTTGIGDDSPWFSFRE